MTYSYTQIAQYLRCPRSYRHRYLDGWREKDNRSALLFGRCFEQALAALNSALNESRASEQQYKDRMAQRATQLRAKQSALAVANSGTPLMFALALVLAAGLVGKNVLDPSAAPASKMAPCIE